MGSRKFLHRLLVAAILLQVPVLRAEEITVAVAANFTAAMGQVKSVFEAQSGHRLIVSFGSSGRLYAQIVNGAPFQVFLSADQEKPGQLVNDELADGKTLSTYAIGALVLWSPDTSADLVDANGLKDGSIARLAIANPRLAPYGAAAMDVLESLGLAGAYRDRLVMGENISQAYQFVDTGNVEAGFVALSQVMEEGSITHGTGWVVPGGLYSPIRQDAVVTLKGKGSPAVREFMDFRGSDTGKSIIKSFGYGTD